MQEAAPGCETTSEEITHCIGSFSCCQPWPGNDSLSLSLAAPLTPSASILPTSPLFSSLSPAYLYISLSLSRTTKKKNKKIKIIKSTGFQGTCECSNHVGPFSVISHNKVTERGRCVGRLREQRERLMEREEDEGSVWETEGGENKIKQSEEGGGHLLCLFIMGAALISIWV